MSRDLDECQDVVEAVTDYLEGALSPEEAAAVRAHLADCDGCDAYVAQVRLVCARLGELPATARPDERGPSLPAPLVDVLTARFAARHPRRP